LHAKKEGKPNRNRLALLELSNPKEATKVLSEFIYNGCLTFSPFTIFLEVKI